MSYECRSPKRDRVVTGRVVCTYDPAEGTSSLCPQYGSQCDKRSFRQRIVRLYNRCMYTDKINKKSRKKTKCLPRNTWCKPKKCNKKWKKKCSCKKSCPKCSGRRVQNYHGDACSYQCTDTSVSVEECCIDDRTRTRWVTSSMAAMLFPEKWLGAMMRELILYSLFLICLCAVVLSSSHPARYYYCHSVYENLLKSPYPVININGDGRTLHTTKVYHEMSTISDQWSFITEVFVPSVYMSQIYNQTVDRTDQGLQMYESVLIGVPRMRQIRVQPGICEVHEQHRSAFNICFDYYYSRNEEKVTHGSKDDNGWKYEKDDKDSKYIGKISNYPGGGYSYILSNELNKTQQSIANLSGENWIDQATRVVFLDLTLYTPSANYFSIIKLVMELPPSGGVVPSAHCHTLKLLIYISYYDYFILGVQIFLLLLLIYYTAQLIREIVFFRSTYFLLFWGVYEIILILMGYIYFFMLLFVYFLSNSEAFKLLDKSIDDNSEFLNFDSVARLNLIWHKFSLVYLFLAFIKLFRFCSVSKICSFFYKNLKDFSMEFISFILLYSAIILVFALIGHVLFGAQVREFSSVGWSFFTLFLVHNYDYRSMERLFETDFILAPLFFYTLRVVLILASLIILAALFVRACNCCFINNKDSVCPRVYVEQVIKCLLERSKKKRCVCEEC